MLKCSPWVKADVTASSVTESGSGCLWSVSQPAWSSLRFAINSARKIIAKQRQNNKGLFRKKTTTKNLTVCFYFSEHNTISIYRMLGIKQLFKQTIWGERQMFARCTIIWPVMKSLQVKRISAEPGTDSCCFRGVMRTCRRCRCRPSSARKTRVLLFAVGRERVR